MLDYNEEISFTHHNEEPSFKQPCLYCTDSSARNAASNAESSARLANSAADSAGNRAKIISLKLYEFKKRVEALEKKITG
ncbi:hypothetical protein PSI19_21440 [Xenorhabdus khoisanae]|uniref:hypothetical protein n=1 Tax=Xenorhabdus khoisanae TaxID=880157 RepID=UPI002358FEF1|nr:hypothetical protein [Xenorhabdus khoisanae]MDC9616358.1 hypothetical protein [Xenorhabdus khoisanae]